MVFSLLRIEREQSKCKNKMQYGKGKPRNVRKWQLRGTVNKMQRSLCYKHFAT